jgi:hypothetical protein
MNSQPSKRVVICAALVALGLACAGLFPTQPVAGQATKPGALHGAAPLFFVSPGQINFQIPPGAATGTATVSFSSGATRQLEITSSAPALFAANADGQGVPAAVALRVKASGANADVLFAGAVAGFAGLDQINVSLPRALVGRGEIEALLRVDGVAANPVRISVR